MLINSSFKESYLQKRSQQFQSWQRRFFVLDNRSFCYYREIGDKKARGVINLNGARLNRIDESKYHRPFVFELVCKNRSYVLQAETYEQLQDWIRVISLSVRLLHHVSTPSAATIEQPPEIVFDIPSDFHQDVPDQLSRWRNSLTYEGLNKSGKHLNIQRFSLRVPQRVTVTHNNSNILMVGSINGIGSTLQKFDGNSMDPMQSILQAEPCLDLSWYNDRLLSACSDGKILFYRYSPESTILPGSPASFLSPEVASNVVSSYGKWINTPAINRVNINPRHLDSFISIQNNYFHIWSLSSQAAPLHFSAASSGSLFSCTWNPESGNEFVLAGETRAIRLYDQRQLTVDRKSEIWSVINAHTGPIRDIAWSPLFSQWLASASDDGYIHIWDLRFGTKPVLKIDAHTNAILSVVWSRSYPDILVSGGSDCSVRLWTLRADPHFLLHSQEDSRAPISNVCVSSINPQQYFGFSLDGDIVKITMTPEFCKPLIRSRFPEDANGDIDEEKSILALLYMRDYETAFSKISALSKRYWENPVLKDRVSILLKMSSSRQFAKAAANHTQFDQLVNDLAFFLPPKSLVNSLKTKKDDDSIQLFQLRVALEKLTEQRKAAEILSLENEIFKHMKNEKKAFDDSLLLDIISTVLQFSYLRALDLAFGIGDILQAHERFSSFKSITALLFYPTIYDSTMSLQSEAMNKKAALILDREFRNHKVVLSELSLLYKVHLVMSTEENCASAVLKLFDAERKDLLLPSCLHRLYYNALLHEMNFDRFFIITSHFCTKMEGYEFAHIIRRMMEEVGFYFLKKFLDSCLVINISTDPTKLIAGAITLINIFENSVFLPPSLEAHGPIYLRTFTENLQSIFQSMQSAGNKQKLFSIVEQVAKMVDQTKENSDSSTSFFTNDINAFDQMLKKFE